jgi:hypothetical protein
VYKTLFGHVIEACWKNELTSIWPPVVKKKTSPIDRKEVKDIIHPKVNEALTNDPMVPSWVFRRECQYAKTCLHQTSIEIDWIAKDVLWQSVCCHSTASEYISVPLSRRSQSKAAWIKDPSS